MWILRYMSTVCAPVIDVTLFGTAFRMHGLGDGGRTWVIPLFMRRFDMPSGRIDSIGVEI